MRTTVANGATFLRLTTFEPPFQFGRCTSASLIAPIINAPTLFLLALHAAVSGRVATCPISLRPTSAGKRRPPAALLRINRESVDSEGGALQFATPPSAADRKSYAPFSETQSGRWGRGTVRRIYSQPILVLARLFRILVFAIAHT